jgi:hypothetical protein
MCGFYTCHESTSDSVKHNILLRLRAKQAKDKATYDNSVPCLDNQSKLELNSLISARKFDNFVFTNPNSCSLWAKHFH